MQTWGPARGEIQSPGPGRAPPLKGQAQPEGSEGSQRGLITLGVSAELDQLGETTRGAERLRLDRRAGGLGGPGTARLGGGARVAGPFCSQAGGLSLMEQRGHLSGSPPPVSLSTRVMEDSGGLSDCCICGPVILNSTTLQK